MSSSCLDSNLSEVLSTTSGFSLMLTLRIDFDDEIKFSLVYKIFPNATLLSH